MDALLHRQGYVPSRLSPRRPSERELMPIVVKAIFSKATTTVDDGWRISFDLATHDGMAVAEIAKLAQQGLQLVIMTEDELNAKITLHEGD